MTMISPIPALSAAQPTTQAAPAQPPTSKAPPPSSGDTVQISNTAKALLQETMETSVQTANEARGGDIQAMRLLARQAAARPSSK